MWLFLYFEENQIQVVPPEIGDLTGLKKLWVSTNQIQLNPPDIGNLTSLTTLWMLA
jgi:Leucine-rich repeat (LRR) protein